MLRGLGLLLVFSCCVLLGWGKAAAMAREAEELGRWREFLRQFRLRLEATRATPRELAQALGKQNAFLASPGIQALAAAFAGSSSFGESMAQVASAGKAPGPAEQVLLGLGDSVGVKPLEEQLSDLRAAELLLEREAEEARERSRRYGGLSRRLGVLMGLMAVVALA